MATTFKEAKEIMNSIKHGDTISFFTSTNAYRLLYNGVVTFHSDLGLITIIDNVTFELIKLVDITILQKANGFRTGYQYHHLNDVAKATASKQNKGTLLSQWLYNIDGTKFVNSTTVDLP